MERGILRIHQDIKVLQISGPLSNALQIAVRSMVGIEVKILSVRFLAGKKEGNSCRE